MHLRTRDKRSLRVETPLIAVLLAATLAACGGGSGSGGGGTIPPPTGGDPQCEDGAVSYSSTFEGIEKAIFEKHGCTQAVCHGSSKQGGLDLSPEAAYRNLVGVGSTETTLARVEPGDKDRSYLFAKLAAATNPGSVQITGAPMPNGLTALSADELEVVRLWIKAGAPEQGTVAGTDKLLDACLPPTKPIVITPLEAPAAGEGVQWVMPEWTLPKQSEREVCFASYYDFTSQVPQEFLDPSGQFVRYSEQELRQDPQSHHLILNYYFGQGDVHDPGFGAWTCKGGAQAGQTCEPKDPTSCGTDGVCGSEVQDNIACIGFGPRSGGQDFAAIGGAQQAQQHDVNPDGVFGEIPVKGILIWNSHAFNLTASDGSLHARINVRFAKKQQYALGGIFDTSHIFAQRTPPYGTETICHDYVVPQGARLFSLSSHTHKRGKDFTIQAPDGSLLYQSFVYNDPVYKQYDPPLVFDSPDPKQRTLHYCSLYNNGMAPDGSPDPSLVKRASTTPQNAISRCRPIACAAGKVGASCSGENDDRTCDSGPGAGDGQCDACTLTGGVSTEDEMFLLLGSFYVVPTS